jgi:surfactin synthase thioesterase subunit
VRASAERGQVQGPGRTDRSGDPLVDDLKEVTNRLEGAMA